ncbi:hypothetical protein J6590_064763 [Homalodisca vitripennis]|nr:hypothetical protein J6590_064763 [Homalodisca vitripennis]
MMEPDDMFKQSKDKAGIAHEFNRFFASVACGRGPRPSEPQVTHTRRRSPVKSMILAPVLEEELEKFIQQLPARK